MILKRKSEGFTLVEIMIVVAIIAVLATISIPGLLRARQSAAISEVAGNLKTFRDAFHMYSLNNGSYPADSHLTLPAGMDSYINPVQFAKPALGGQYNWEGPSWGEGGPYAYAGISLFGTTATVSELTQLDTVLDDGDLGTGSFRLEGGRYTYIIAE